VNVAIVNIDLILAGAIVTDVTSIVVTQLSLRRRFALGAVGIAGLVLMLLRVPDLADARVALLASAGYAIAACGAAILLLMQEPSAGLARRLRSAVLVAGGAMVLLLGTVTWIAVRA
jgi:hypothetical protein